MRIKEVRTTCPITGESYTRRELVPSVDEKTQAKLELMRGVAEIVIDQKAASEASHMRQATARRCKQTIGWKS